MVCKLKDKASNVCKFKDALTPILEEIAGADGLVLGSPVYFGDITAQMRIGRHQSRRNRTPRGA
jgi:multimeric flavodoxin WrbA